MRPPRKLRSLQDLTALKKAMAESARRVAEARAEAARVQRERDLFALTVGPVQPLRRGVVIPLERPRAEPLPRQRAREH